MIRRTALVLLTAACTAAPAVIPTTRPEAPSAHIAATTPSPLSETAEPGTPPAEDPSPAADRPTPHEDPAPRRTPPALPTLSAIRLGVHPDRERVVLDLGARVDASVEILADLGVVRVHLPGTVSASNPGAVTGRGLVAAVYAVTRADAGQPRMFADVHTRARVRTELIILGDRVAIDLWPAEGDWSPAPVVSARGALLSPRTLTRGEVVVSGYAAPFEASGVLELVDANGQVVVQQLVSTHEWSATMGWFDAQVDTGSLSPGSYQLRLIDVGGDHPSTLLETAPMLLE